MFFEKIQDSDTESDNGRRCGPLGPKTRKPRSFKLAIPWINFKSVLEKIGRVGRGGRLLCCWLKIIASTRLKWGDSQPKSTLKKRYILFSRGRILQVVSVRESPRTTLRSDYMKTINDFLHRFLETVFVEYFPTTLCIIVILAFIFFIRLP